MLIQYNDDDHNNNTINNHGEDKNINIIGLTLS